MKTILHIIKHELKTRVFSWITIIFMLMLVFQGIWYTKGAFDFYVNEGVLMNAPSIFYRNFAGLGMLMVIIIAIVTGGVLFKDIQHKTADWVYAMPINEKHFFLGRYLSAFLYLTIVGSGVFIGMLLVPYVGIGASHRFGPAPILQMLHGVLLFFIPNVLMYVSIIFASIIFFKRNAVGYLASLFLVVLFIVMQVSYDESADGKLLYLLADPSGFVATQNYAENLTTLQKNTEFIKLSGYVLLNRIIWFGLAVVLFIWSYFNFSFKSFITAGTSQKKRSVVAQKTTLSKNVRIPKVRLKYGFGEFLAKLFKLAKLELLNVVRPTSFKIILGVMMLMIFMQNLLFNASFYIGHEVPVTSNMTYFRLPWGVFITMLLMIWSGELFFKEKVVKIWQITDALPVPVWVSQLAKLLASFGLALILCLSFIVIGIVSQIIEGGAHLIDMKRYVLDVLGFRWGLLNFMLQICLVFFVAGLTGKRFLTYILTIGYFLIVIISLDMGLVEQKRYLFGGSVGVSDFSEMSGYGILTNSIYWFLALWGSLCVALVLLGILFWHRGIAKKWYRKPFGNQLYAGGKIAVVVFLGVFFGLQYYLNGQIYSNGNFTAEEEEEELKAAYETKYNYLVDKSQPKYQEIDLKLDYYPEERKVDYAANIWLQNTTVDTLFINIEDFVSISDLSLNKQQLTQVYADETHNIYGYMVPEQFRKDSVLQLQIGATKLYIGWSQGELQEDITANGSFASIKEFLPTFGYNYDKELDENRIRVDIGLEGLKNRMAALSDPIARNQSAFCEDAAFGVRGSIVISTPKDQTPLAPGIHTKSWEENNRNYNSYSIPDPVPFNWYVGSAVYTAYKGSSNEVAYTIFAHHKHPFNIELYHDAMKKGISTLQDDFGMKLPKQVRLYEINRWAEDPFYTFPNGMAISEKDGWYADTENKTAKAYMYQNVYAQLAKVWVTDHLKVANVQGADMLRVALPEAIGLYHLKKQQGEDHLKLILKKKQDKYGKDKNNEANTEPSLLYADGAEYLEINKGAIAVYKLLQILGKSSFTQEIYNVSNQENPVVFKTLYEAWLQKVPADQQAEVRTWFEEVK